MLCCVLNICHFTKFFCSVNFLLYFIIYKTHNMHLLNKSQPFQFFFSLFEWISIFDRSKLLSPLFYLLQMIYKLPLSLNQDLPGFLPFTSVTCLDKPKQFKIFKIPLEPSLECKITNFRPIANVFLRQIHFWDNESKLQLIPSLCSVFDRVST